MRTNLLLALFIALASLPLAAQTALSLSDAIQAGLANNYAIRLAEADLDVARSNDDWALTGRRPTINLGLTPGVSYRNSTNPASVVVNSSIWSFAVTPTANLNWTLFNGGRVEIAKEQLAGFAELAAGQLQVQVETSVAAIVTAYYNAVVAAEQIDVRRQVLELSADQIEYQQLRAEYGQGGSFDEIQARDAFLTDSSNLVTQQLQYRLAVRNLLQLIGSEDLDQELNLTTPLGETAPVYDRASLENQLLTTNSQLRALRVNETLADINTRLIETEYKPSVALQAGLNYDYSVQTGTQTFVFGDAPPNDVDLPGIGAQTFSGQLGLGVNYLLFDGGARNVRRQTAELEARAARLNTASLEQQLRTTLATTLDRYENQAEIVDLTRRLIANAERNLGIAEERFRGGTINSFDFRTVQLNFVNARFQLLNALLQLRNTETEILRLTGGIVD